MSGHSKWSTIKRQKGVADARRGQLFTKLTREIMVAARQGGGNPDLNIRLKLAVQKARYNSMPMENIERAIKKATGEGGSQNNLEEITYEGYGPGGTAILLQALTDNRNRSAAEVRAAFARGGGNLGESGCVAWLFEQKGFIVIQADPETIQELALMAIDLGAEDFNVEDTTLELYSTPENFESLRRALEERGVKISLAELSQVPKSTVPLEPKVAEQAIRLLDRLEELDDVQRVYSNADFPNEVLQKYQSEG